MGKSSSKLAVAGDDSWLEDSERPSEFGDKVKDAYRQCIYKARDCFSQCTPLQCLVEPSPCQDMYPTYLAPAVPVSANARWCAAGCGHAAAQQVRRRRGRACSIHPMPLHEECSAAVALQPHDQRAACGFHRTGAEDDTACCRLRSCVDRRQGHR